MQGFRAQVYVQVFRPRFHSSSTAQVQDSGARTGTAGFEEKEEKWGDHRVGTPRFRRALAGVLARRYDLKKKKKKKETEEAFKTRRRNGGGAAPPHPPPRGGLRPPLPPPRLSVHRYALPRFHSKAESHTSLRLRQRQMHRFRITERPCAQLQDSGRLSRQGGEIRKSLC